jgi:hypothetical protein
MINQSKRQSNAAGTRRQTCSPYHIVVFAEFHIARGARLCTDAPQSEPKVRWQKNIREF